MAGIGKLGEIIGKLAAPVADDVARAAAGFGDDAVESLMRVTPDMRNRLLNLAKKRAASSAESKTRKVGSRAELKPYEVKNIVETFLLKEVKDPFVKVPNIVTRPTDGLEMRGLKDVVGYELDQPVPSYGLFGFEKFSKDETGALARREDFRKEAVRRLNLEEQFYKDFPEELLGYTPAQAVARQSSVAADAAKEYEQSVLDIVSGNLPTGIEAEMSVAKRAAALREVLFPPKGYRTPAEQTNLRALTGQLDLIDVLRRMGDAQ